MQIVAALFNQPAGINELEQYLRVASPGRSLAGSPACTYLLGSPGWLEWSIDDLDDLDKLDRLAAA